MAAVANPTPETRLATARFQWEDGARRLAAARRSASGRVLAEIDRVQRAVTAEIRRRAGADFGQDDLAAVYDTAGDWAGDLATRTAPETPEAWEPGVAVDAPFFAMWRQARDHDGRRRTSRRSPDLPPGDGD